MRAGHDCKGGLLLYPQKERQALCNAIRPGERNDDEEEIGSAFHLCRLRDMFKLQTPKR